MALDVRHLQLLVALDAHGSLHAAAARLHLSPSALSLQLRELEGHLGGRLFERRWRRLHATAAGEHLTRSARALLAGVARAEVEARELLSGRTGVLRITTECMQSYRWLPAVLEAWTRAHPDAQVTIVGEAGHAPLDAIRAGDVDLAIVVGDHPATDRVAMTPLFEDELVALVSADHHLARKRRVAVRDLANEPYWGAPDSFGPRTPLGRALAEAGATFARVTPLAFSSGAPVEMVRAGLGVTVCPRWFVASDIARGDLVGLRIGKGLWLDWSAASPGAGGSPLTASFVAKMKQHRPVGRPPSAR